MKKYLLNLLLLLISANAAYAMPKTSLVDTLIKLDITEAQKSQIATILKSSRVEVRPKVDALISARKNLKATISQEQFDETKIRAASREVAKVQEDLAVIRASVRAKLMQVLNEEQRKTIADLEQKFSKRSQDKIIGFRKLLNYWVDRHAQG